MNRTQYRAILVKQIHISKRWREYYKSNRDDYVDLLQTHFGVSSSKDMQIDQLVMLRDWMNFQLANLPIQKPKNEMATPEQLSIIRSIWTNYANDASDTALLKFAKRIVGTQYLHLKSLPCKEAQKLIPVLLKMQKKGD
jgi:hypothetical protein